MRMGNYFRVSPLPATVMSAKRSESGRSEFGIHHVTVVPTNFQADDDEDDTARTPSR